MPECVTCGRIEHVPDANYCKDCGTDLYYPIICKCGKTNHNKVATFCNKCGEIIRYCNISEIASYYDKYNKTIKYFLR